MHKGTAYPGEHDAIVPRDLWDRVQATFAGNRHQRREGVLKSGRVLTGLLFDDCGNRMSPSIVRNRHGRRYAYYVSHARLTGRSETVGAMPRMPAGEIEALVENRVRALLREPGRRAWDALAPAERVERLRAVVRRVVIGAEAATIELMRHEDFRRPDGGRGRVAADESIGESEDGLTIRIPIQLRNRGGERIIEAPDGMMTTGAARPDRALIKAVVRAYAWREALEQGTASSTADLAKRAGCHVRYVRNLIKLGFLAPDFVEAIIAGKPIPLNLAGLIAVDLTLSWSRQKSIFGACGRPSDS